MLPFLKVDVCKFMFDPQFSQYEDHSLCACGMERAIQHHRHFYATSKVENRIVAIQDGATRGKGKNKKRSKKRRFVGEVRL
jgi:hypothetical protein